MPASDARGESVANFYKERGMETAGYDAGANKQSLALSAMTDVALFGG